ncbi:Fructose-2,6-bisphosphatase [Wickerhamiella sorbophila]|uniref:fructose-2,6-bisphosphate 2-phosphatase n=1 Tax=Wickerhamiella sorbophila TaxID=45607 RepID=A0A2T0FJP7_9ASCO|nr:Fructose-2,6-bisphosphatase [Wickerhamiella sorbophila]PRT55211.1 Fructose-2,6-bisphosphatase [Wickerhamiella sorbophila]
MLSSYVCSDPNTSRVCVVMVGLPARGKSLMSQKIVRYLKWRSISAKAFNIGNYRRKANAHPSADFFALSNDEGASLRRLAAQEALNDLVSWMDKEGGRVAIYDGTNSTKRRRAWIAEQLSQHNIHPLFIESACENDEIILNNIMDVKTTSPDYKGVDPQTAAKDFINRIEVYRKDYESISSSEMISYLKIIDAGAQVVVNKVKSYLESHIVYYLMNLHIKPRRLWLSRHGESEYNVLGLLGGNSNLSERGMMYAEKLPELVANAVGDQPLTVWTSTLKRTQQTASKLPYQQIQWKALDELDAGVCDGLTYEEIQQKYPEDFAARDENKFEYRYKGGESYRDVVTRLDPIIMELERQENILIVTHQAVLRCIYAYYMDVPQEQSPWMNVPLHTLICLEPRAYGTIETRISANIPAVSTFRAKGELPQHQEPDGQNA